MIDAQELSDRERSLIARYFEGSLDESESAALRGSLLRSGEARAAFGAFALQRRLVAVCLAGAAPLAESTPANDDRRAGGRRLVWRSRYALAAVLMLGLCVALIAAGIGGRRTTADDRPVAARRPAVVATISFAAGEVVSGSAIFTEGDDLSAETVTTTGDTELSLRSGAEVRISGSSELRLDGAMRVTMIRGDASFHCPPSAHGFTVDVPGGVRAVDVGTEFRAVTDAAGVTHLSVSEGVVKVVEGPSSGGPERAAEEPIATLVAGERVRIQADGLVERVETTPLAIVNGSFELGAGERVIGAEERFVPVSRLWGWRGSDGHAVSQIRRSDAVETIADNFAGGGASGDRVAQVNAEGPPASPPAMTQDLDMTYEAGQTYVLSVCVGRRADHDELGLSGASWAIALCDASTGEVIGGGSAVLVGELSPGDGGVMREQVLRCTVGDRDHGRRVQVRLMNRTTTSAFNAVNFDNVRLVAERRLPLRRPASALGATAGAVESSQKRSEQEPKP